MRGKKDKSTAHNSVSSGANGPFRQSAIGKKYTRCSWKDGEGNLNRTSAHLGVPASTLVPRAGVFSRVCLPGGYKRMADRGSVVEMIEKNRKALALGKTGR